MVGCSSSVGTLVSRVPAPPASIQQSEFDHTLKCRWKEAAESGLCRYRLNRIQNKILPGKYQFVVQSKPGWRRQSQNFQKVNMEFDGGEFNFNQIESREILMNSEELDEDTFLVINASPIEFGSCILVPQLTANIPQIITLHGLEVLLRTVLLSTDPHLKAGFSSPGGCASVNHQHYHLYYLEEQLYLESSPTKHIAGPCYAVTDGYPSKGFAFQLDKDPNQLAKHVFTLADYMRQNEIAHNMFITRGRRFELGSSSDIHYETIRVFLWAREPAFGAKKDYGINPALCELAGHVLTTDFSEYGTVTEKSVCAILHNMTAPLFHRLLLKIPLLYQNK